MGYILISSYGVYALIYEERKLNVQTLHLSYLHQFEIQMVAL